MRISVIRSRRSGIPRPPILLAAQLLAALACPLYPAAAAAAGEPAKADLKPFMDAGLEALYARQKPDEAAAYFRKVLKLVPRHYGATYQLAKSLEAAGHLQEARPIWLTAMALALDYQDAATADTAQTALGRLAVRVPAPDEIELMRAGLVAMYRKHAYSEAAVLFREVLARDPDHFEANLRLAKALDLANLGGESRPHWETVLRAAERLDDAQTLDAARQRLGLAARPGGVGRAPVGHSLRQLPRLLFSAAFFLTLLVPAWWLAGRVQDRRSRPAFQLLCAIGLALMAYLSIVNLIGRLTERSTAVALVYLALNAAAGVALWRRSRAEFHLRALAASWRSWVGPLLLALAIGVPQWLLAVSTPFWDEVLPSAVNLTAANQFADGLFPPRHNSLPDVTIKYHYAFTMLSGTLQWLTGLSPNICTDLASTGLWLFVFLFVYFWLRDFEFGLQPALWGSVAALLGGGLAWLYAPRVEVYRTGGFVKVPAPSDLLHRWDAGQSWIENVHEAGQAPSLHLRNGDGSLSNLPWDIAAQFQQHAVSAGLALTVIALYLLSRWLASERFHVPLAITSVATFSLGMLGHAVFGAVAIVTACLCLLGYWLVRPVRVRFLRGLTFACLVPPLAFLHGGMLTAGAEYGTGSFTTLRSSFGYAAGGMAGFLNWNLAGFGIPLLLAIVGWVAHARRRDAHAAESSPLFWVFTAFAGFSYLVPQVMFYSSETSGVEQFTEISKFFFCARFGLALMSVFGLVRLLRLVPRWAVLPGFAAIAVTPLSFCYSSSFRSHQWIGFYTSPYELVGGMTNVEVQTAVALKGLKHGNREAFFDPANDEGTRGYLSGLFIRGGSIFSLTPRAFERNGVGFRLAESVVGKRLAESSRMARLLPGAPEQTRCNWYYSRPSQDTAFVPTIVRSRFEKLVSDGRFVKKVEVGARVLYRIEGSTVDLDRDIERYWTPRIAAQTHSDWDGDGKDDLVFLDYLERRVLIGDAVVQLPRWLQGEFAPLYVGHFPGDTRADLMVGRMDDTFYRMGRSIDENQEHNTWMWTYRDSASDDWKAESGRWFWDWDIPIVADLDNSGESTLIAYGFRTRTWSAATGRKLVGPVIDQSQLPLPFAGRFLPGSTGDLGLWSLTTNQLMLHSLSTGQDVSFRWGSPGDMLVAGDYDGDGYDEVAVWNRSNRTWYWRHPPDGPITEATFGTATGIPVPFDYNHDGKLDLAYWEPRDRRIYVSLTHGRSVDLVVPVPDHSIPAFVNW